ncbi:MAG: type II toxin-antitoxin system VapC family toxin [marine benthic group bacterium]|nr:type II toxin-antitoxin system VapC family toxin [Gemmatimonadota bacterium]MCL7974032.1 type II toxin-antitoxin system VapC family toxin [Gemmatimonadota bacterium]MCL7977158.1 type II toxin-antitoxin system VapC family toxin [Gemmatimonadota bacterium]MCL7979545.1 type II toxin-antitoxin system VapC family toxin [Gemmatimonadota bacterium]
MRFWDSSAVAALCVEEPRTAEVERLAREDPELVVWWATPVECASAIARRRREGSLSTADELAAIEVLDQLAQTWVEVQPGDLLRSHAFRLLRVHSLRAGDALQLAAALVWAGMPVAGPAPGAELVTFDERLASAARLEGLAVLPASRRTAAAPDTASD